MIWLVVVLAWCGAAFGAWSLCVAAGRAERAAELIAAAQRDRWPGAERLGAVRDDFPKLTDPQVYAVAQARARLALRAPGPLG